MVMLLHAAAAAAASFLYCVLFPLIVCLCFLADIGDNCSHQSIVIVVVVGLINYEDATSHRVLS